MKSSHTNESDIKRKENTYKNYFNKKIQFMSELLFTVTFL